RMKATGTNIDRYRRTAIIHAGSVGAGPSGLIAAFGMGQSHRHRGALLLPHRGRPSVEAVDVRQNLRDGLEVFFRDLVALPRAPEERPGQRRALDDRDAVG